jgi:hypothetical protein
LTGITTPQSSLSENTKAADAAQRATGNSNSRAVMLQEAWQPFIDEIQRKTGQEFYNPARHLNKGIFSGGATRGTNQFSYRHGVEKIIDFAKNNTETLGVEFEQLNHDFIMDRAIKLAQDRAEENQQVAARSNDWKKYLGQFAGAAYGSFDDPIIQSTIGTGAIMPGLKTLYSLMFREAIIGGTSEALIQTEVADWYKTLDLPYTWEDFVINVSSAAALSAAFPLVFKVGGDTVKLTASQAKKGYEAIKKAHQSVGQRSSAAADTAADMVDEIENTFANKPINDVDEHLNRMDAVDDAVNEGVLPGINDEPASGVTQAELQKQANPGQGAANLEEVNKEIAQIEEARDLFQQQFKEEEEAIALELDQLGKTKELTNDDFVDAIERTDALESKKNLDDAKEILTVLNEQKKDLETQLEAQPKVKPRANINDVVARYEIDELNVDAKSFQFKEGGDEFGVTERLKDITKWDPGKAGTVYVYEQADGKLFIADGHQRLGLAKRIKKQNPKQDIFLLGHIMREKDGISRDQAMATAAMKNISEGTGTVLDAVKVLRGDKKLFAELPPRSALVRMARNIVNIEDDEAFGLFVNGLVSPQQASVVGRMIPEDPVMQRAAMNVIAKVKPENEVQTEAVTRQVMDSGTEKVNQESLFGDRIEEESLYFERAKVLDNAIKILQRDKSAFNTIVRNQTKFESAGNKLVRSANEQKIQKDAEAIDLIQTLANRRGQLSDDLTAAARAAKRDGKYGSATDSFVEAVRGAVGRGDFYGQIPSNSGRAINAPPQNGEIPANAAEKNLDDFDDAAGVGSQQQMNQMEVDMFPPLREGLEPEVVETKLKLAQPIETVDDIYELAPAAQDWLAGTGKRLETELGVKFENPGLKEKATSDEKMLRKRYETAQQMTDVVRGGFVVKSLDEANKISEEFSKVADVLDTGWQVYPEGYSDRKLLVRTPNGIIAEIQMWTPEVKAAKFGKGTELYTKARSAKDPAEIASLNEQQKVLYRDALKKDIQASEGKLSGIDSGPKVLSNIDLNEASSATRLAEWKTSRASTSSQVPPGLTTATASRGSSDSSAGLKSQLQNETDDLAISSSPIKSIDESAQNVNTEAELDYQVPVDTTLDAEGNLTVINQTMRQIKEEIDYEDKMIERMGYCVK